LSAQLIDDKGSSIEGEIIETGDEGQSNLALFDLQIQEELSLRLKITDTDNHPNVNPPLVVIYAEQDQPPTIQIKRPGADWAVHRIAEINFEVEAGDDYGVSEVAWEYHINDQPPVTEVLMTTLAGQSASREQRVSRNLALEDLNLQVGDSMVYRFKANDQQPDLKQSVAWSQPFFLTIRPFEQAFFKGEQKPPGSGVPIPSERQVIVATLRLLDRQDSLAPDEVKEISTDIASTQNVVRTETQKLRSKLQGLQDVPDLSERLAHLDTAVEEMQQAEQLLSAIRPEEALPHENSALRHQIAALAGLPQFQNWANSAMASPFPPDPMTDLLGQRLEFDKDKYELFDKAKGQQMDQQLQEALEKVRALARRQKEFMETVRRELKEDRQGNAPPGNLSEDERANPEEEMRRQSEENRRLLDRLREAVEALDQLDDETLRKLKQAVNQAAQELAKLDNALSKKDLEQAEGANARAMEELLNLDQELESTQRRHAQQQLRQILARVDQWIQRQQVLKEQTGSLKDQSTPELQQARDEVVQKQVQLQEETQVAADILDRTGDDGPVADRPALNELNKQLSQAGDWMQQAAENIEASRDSQAQRGQDAVVRQLQKVQDALQKHIAQQAGSPLERLQQALATVRALQDELQPDGNTQSTQSGQQESQQQGTSPAPTTMMTGSDSRAISLTPRQLRLRLEQVNELIQDNKRLETPFKEVRLKLTSQSNENQGASPGGGSGEGMSEDMVQTLEAFEALLIEQIELLGHMHRLEQMPQEDLPPIFREMADKYFEALAAGDQTE
jgi:hypothetical protein